jgi:hypothetical protein
MKKTPKNTDEEDYLAAAVAFHKAREEYGHKRSNKLYDKLYLAARKIRLHSTDGGAAFFESLLDHPMSYVASAAAFNLIPFNPKLARATYERLAKVEDSEAGVFAETTLKEWKAGRLDPDWFMKE